MAHAVAHMIWAIRARQPLPVRAPHRSISLCAGAIPIARNPGERIVVRPPHGGTHPLVAGIAQLVWILAPRLPEPEGLA